jgi:hypothetical protein
MILTIGHSGSHLFFFYFTSSSPAYGPFFTGGFLDVATTEGNFAASFSKISKISKCFCRSNQKLKKYFSYQLRCKKIKNHYL